jgi:cobyrinic acid a,c-diamide synthase
MKAFIVSGSATGVGKTTVTAGIMAILRKRGLRVQPFKCGPDFIDPGHHAKICTRPSHNLDTWMLSADQNRDIFTRACRNADVAVIEGMMGLFDGVDGKTDAGSTAEIAKLLNVPVVLVVDAWSAARSIAAVVLGFRQFDPKVRMAGVVLNRVANHHHARLLLDALGDPNLPAGWLPVDSTLVLPERHLGLRTAEEQTWTGEGIEVLCRLIEENVPIDQILGACDVCISEEFDKNDVVSEDKVRIGVARDHAFCFYYEAGLDELRRQGAELIQFSPLASSSLPEDLGALYFGGGYPELYAEELSRNESLISQIRQFAADGKPIYGECGGLIYLCRLLQTNDGKLWPMTNLLPLSIQMTNSPVHFGYADLHFLQDGFAEKGTSIRGHSFHYSSIADFGNVETCAFAAYSLSGKTHREGFTAGSVFGSYIHIHFAAVPAVAKRFIAMARRSQEFQVSR